MEIVTLGCNCVKGVFSVDSPHHRSRKKGPAIELVVEESSHVDNHRQKKQMQLGYKVHLENASFHFISRGGQTPADEF